MRYLLLTGDLRVEISAEPRVSQQETVASLLQLYADVIVLQSDLYVVYGGEKLLLE